MSCHLRQSCREQSHKAVPGEYYWGWKDTTLGGVERNYSNSGVWGRLSRPPPTIAAKVLRKRSSLNGTLLRGVSRLEFKLVGLGFF
eukprot:3717427-Amphidinium_carterae.4